MHNLPPLNYLRLFVYESLLKFERIHLNLLHFLMPLLKILVSTWTEIITQPSLMRLLRRYTTPALRAVFSKRRLQALAVFNGCVIIYVSLLMSPSPLQIKSTINCFKSGLWSLEYP